MGSRRIQGITIKIGGDASELNKALKSVDSQISKTKSSLRDVDRLLKFSPGNTELLTQKQKQLTTQIAATKARLAELKSVSRDSVGSNAEWDALQREIVATEQDLKRLQGEYRNFGSVASQKVAAVGEKLKEVGSKISSVGQSLTTSVTLPLAAAGAASVKTFAEVDSTMKLTNATMGNTAKEAKMLDTAMEEAAAKSVFGMNEAATATLNFARAGLDANQAASALAPSMNLAAGAGGDLGIVSNGLVATINGFGDSFGNAESYADVFANACNNSALEINSLMDSMSVAAPIFSAAGYSVNDAALYMGTMANAGIDANVAANSLKTGLARLVSPPKAAADKMKELGISVTNADGSMKDSVQVQSELHAAFSQLSESEQLAAASAIFGKNQMAPWLALINTAPEKVNSLSTALQQEKTSSEMAAAMMDGFGGSLKELGSSLNVAAKAMGEALAPTVSVVAEKIKEAVTWFNGLNESQQQTIAKVALLVAAVGPLLLIGGQLITGIGMFMTFAPVVGGAIATVAGFFTGTLIPAIGGVIAAVAPLVAAFAPFIAIGAAVVAAGVLIYKNWDTIKAKATQLATAIKTKFNEIKNVVTVVCKALVVVAKSKFEEMGKEVSSKIDAIKTTISKGFEAAKSSVTNIVTAIKSAISKGFEEAKTTVTNVVNAIKTAISKGFEAAKSSVTNIVTAIKTVVSSRFGEVAKAVSTKMEDVKKAIQTKLDAAKKFFDVAKWLTVGEQMVTGIIKGVTSRARDLVTNIKNLASNAVKAAKERLSIHSPSQVFADEIGKNIALGVAQGVRANEKYASESIEKMSSAIIGAAKIKYKELEATNPLTLEQEKQFWLQIAAEVQQGTSAYATAMENVKKADEAIIQEKTEFANSIQQQMSLFDQIDQKEKISGAKLLQNMKSQVQSVKSWAENIKELGRRGVSEGLLAYLANMGPQGSVYVSAFTQMTNAQIKQANKVFQQSMQVPQQAAESVKQSYINAGRNASQGFANGLNPNAANNKAKQLGNNASKSLSSSLQEHSPSKVTMASGKNFSQGFANGISQNMSPITQSVANLETAVRKGIKKLDNQGEWADIGKQLVKGLAKGVTENGSSLVNEIEKLATKAVKAAKKKLKIKSPSRIFADEVGQWIPAGIAQGVENNLTSIDKAMQTASSAAVGSFAGSAAVAGNSQSYTTNMGGLTINVYGQQGQSAQEIAQEVNNIINRQVQQQNMAWGAA